MPRGVYEKTRLYRNTNKLTEALGALKYHDPDFKPTSDMTNDDIFTRLRALGFRYSEGQWRATFRRRSSSNGHIADMLPDQEVVITPLTPNQLEMYLAEGQLETVQNVIDAMHTLGFKVSIKITGTR